MGGSVISVMYDFINSKRKCTVKLKAALESFSQSSQFYLN